ncbi:MAG: type I-F CRISPR-associated protein Csy1 [Arenicella sp.]
MLDPAVVEFFQVRKEAWLKKNIKASMDAEDVLGKEAECEEVFSLEHWLPNAAKRAGQMSISTHPCTFSHPSSRKNKNGYASSIIAKSVKTNDGYLRTGNVTVAADALGNAAALDVHKFLTLEMADGDELLAHIQCDSDLALALLKINSHSYQELKTGFLAMTEQKTESITSSKIKQVYFPVDDNYHQLSLLTASGMVFELRQRIDTLRFSDGTKEARACEKQESFHPVGYKQLTSITSIAYGGTKPQNISVLNNQNGGRAHLLLSAPPVLDERKVQFPLVDFFQQSISPFQYKNTFTALHALFVKYHNNWEIRAERDEYYQEIIDRIIQKMWALRFVSSQQYNPERSQLDRTQKVWLLDEHQELREQDDDWLDDLVQKITQFIFNGYEKVLKKKAFMFSEAEFKHIYTIVEQSKEALR